MVVESGSRVSGVGRVESGRYSSYLFFLRIASWCQSGEWSRVSWIWLFTDQSELKDVSNWSIDSP